MSFRMRKIILFLMVFAVVIQFCFAEASHLYSSWDTLELDTCASAWLIKNFVERNAEFKFYPKGEFISEGIAFDTPDAKLRRTKDMSTFEMIIKEYNLQDKILTEIGKMIHDVEIEFWALNQKELELNQKIRFIINQSRAPEEALEKSFVVFEELYNSLK